MKNKGFTLIELLAVIVILAVIALIATPIILNIIDEAKKETKERSKENYITAAKQAIAIYGMNNPEQTVEGECTVTTEGNLDCSGTIIQVKIDGEKPLAGSTLTFENGKLVSSNIQMGGEANPTVGPTEPEANVICTLEGTAQDESKYTAGDRYLCKVDPNEEEYGFYVLTTVDKSSAETVDLISEANIDLTTGKPITEANPIDTGLVAWVSQTDYNAAPGTGDYGSYGKNSKGPITAMNALQTATSSWTNLDNIKINYTDNAGSGGYGKIITDENGTTRIYHKDNIIVTEYTNLKARLPYKDELTAAECISGNNSCPKWLSNYLQNSSSLSQKNSVTGVKGYWTLSSSDSDRAWYLHYVDSYVNNFLVSIDSYSGVRPVITVSKANLS